jgi:hypothetical protein
LGFFVEFPESIISILGALITIVFEAGSPDKFNCDFCSQIGPLCDALCFALLDTANILRPDNILMFRPRIIKMLQHTVDFQVFGTRGLTPAIDNLMDDLVLHVFMTRLRSSHFRPVFTEIGLSTQAIHLPNNLEGFLLINFNLPSPMTAIYLQPVATSDMKPNIAVRVVVDGSVSNQGFTVSANDIDGFLKQLPLLKNKVIDEIDHEEEDTSEIAAEISEIITKTKTAP